MLGQQLFAGHLILNELAIAGGEWLDRADERHHAGLRLTTTDPDFGKQAFFNVFRYQRDILKDSAVGVFLPIAGLRDHSIH
jgi:hypothetical protein